MNQYNVNYLFNLIFSNLKRSQTFLYKFITLIIIKIIHYVILLGHFFSLPPYSPDLTSCDFSINSKVSLVLYVKISYRKYIIESYCKRYVYNNNDEAVFLIVLGVGYIFTIYAFFYRNYLKKYIIKTIIQPSHWY